MTDFSRVRITGRCLEDGGILWLTFSLSEAAFRLKGASRLAFLLKTQDPQENPARLNVAPRFAVDVDGIRRIDRRLTKGEERVAVPIPSGQNSAQIRLLKLSECTQSILGLAEIETDGEIAPLPEKGLRIEFIGDSITCGYGVEAKSAAETFSTTTENAEKSFAGLLAGKLNATAHLTAYSGHGIVSGYTGDPMVRNTDILVPPLYEAYGSQAYVLPSGRRLNDIPWDFSRFQPDLIVINLGTNDISWVRDNPDRKALFRKGYTDFLQQVRKKNPNSKILCILGTLGTALNQSMEAAVSDYRKITGDREISALLLPEQDTERDGAGADFHPSAVTQRRLAEYVLQALLDSNYGVAINNGI